MEKLIKRTLIAAVLLTLLAAWTHGTVGGAPSCSNGFDFSQSCNSVYFVAVF
jgi:hypothetical protein